MLYCFIMPLPPQALAGGWERERSPLKKISLRRSPQPEEAPQRIPWPDYAPTAETGLSSAQAAELLSGGWGNEAVASPTKSDRQIVRENVFTYFNLIFLILAVCLLIVGDWKDMSFLLIVAANTGIGIAQQIKSKRTIEKLTLLSEAKVPTVRDGKLTEVHSHELVRGDVIELSPGSQIPADAEVLSGQIQANEGLITGEVDAIPKDPGDALLSGSFVISGRCRCRLTKVGAESYAAKLTLAAKRQGGAARSEMMRSLNALIRFIGIALIPIGIALFYNQYVIQGLGFRQSMVSMVAALIGMIPEGLFLLTSVALALSVVRLARNKTLIHEMNAVETLARVDVLCVDKTGTVTLPEMELREVLPLDEASFSGQQIEETLGAFYRAMEADNDTARAIQKRYPSGPYRTVRKTVPFRSATKWSAVDFGADGCFAIGAPECILGPEGKPLEETLRGFAARGCRVLLLAQCDGAEEGRLLGVVIPLALLVLENPVRPSAPKTFDYFRTQGVTVKVISGDNPVTVSAVARQAGIEGAENWIDARELETDQDIARAVRHYTVFGRVVPNQKRKIVRALQSAGHTVAMTGDGVNDVLALKDADCGIAMASGAEAACQAAQLVLLNSDFAALPKVVAEGRRVINNIQRASALYLVKNILSFFLAIITLFADFPYPFVPIQLTLLSALTIGVPSFFLALEPNHDLVQGKFLHNVFRRSFPGGLAAIIVLLFAELFVYALDLPVAELSTICVVVMAVNGLTVLCYASRPVNLPRLVMIAGMALGLAAAMIAWGPVFSLTGLNLIGWLVLIVLTALVVPVQMGLEKLFDRASAYLAAHRKRAARRAARRRTFREEE